MCGSIAQSKLIRKAVKIIQSLLFHKFSTKEAGAKILKYFQAMLIININSSPSIYRDNFSDSFPKLRSVECAILANYITDFHHNQRKYKEKYTMLQKEFDSVERDGMWRAKCELKK